MSKAGRKLLKKTVEKIRHSAILKVNILAGMAMPGPPLGTQLGQRSINIPVFCKDFNERTANIKKGIPIPCRISLNSDRSYNLVMHSPPGTFFLKQAAGIQRGSMMAHGKDFVGKVTLKHIYEIAKIKLQDPPSKYVSEQQMCKMLIATASSCGIQVVKDLDPKEYAEYLEEQRIIVEQQKQELLEKKESKMLRTPV